MPTLTIPWSTVRIAFVILVSLLLSNLLHLQILHFWQNACTTEVERLPTPACVFAWQGRLASHDGISAQGIDEVWRHGGHGTSPLSQSFKVNHLQILCLHWHVGDLGVIQKPKNFMCFEENRLLGLCSFFKRNIQKPSLPKKGRNSAWIQLRCLTRSGFTRNGHLKHVKNDVPLWDDQLTTQVLDDVSGTKFVRGAQKNAKQGEIVRTCNWLSTCVIAKPSKVLNYRPPSFTSGPKYVYPMITPGKKNGRNHTWHHTWQLYFPIFSMKKSKHECFGWWL